MDKENCSSLTEFLFLGITTNSEIKGTLFTILMVVYLINILANLGMIILIRIDSQRHTPMYFFLSHLAFCDLCDSTAIGPKMLHVQQGVVHALGWGLPDGKDGCSDSYNFSISLMFCGSNETNHFFCDLFPLYLLSCSDTQVNELILFTMFGFIELSTISGVLVPYCYIILSVFKIQSVEERFKAFSTCTSHLTAVAVFHGIVVFMYFKPSSSYSSDQDKIISLLYALVIPMLNPFIYSLQNKDMKEALERLKNKR